MVNPDVEDPFLEVQSDVQQTLKSTRHLFSSYLRIRTLSSSSTSPELLQSRSDLATNLETLTTDLSDLLASVKAVESDPYRFGIDVLEVERRRAFVVEVGREVESMRSEIMSTSGSALPNPDSFRDDYNHASDDEGPGSDAYAEFEHAQQQTMMREQDEQLDGVFRSVGVLRGQAEDMGRELEEQGHMLDDVDTLADRVGGKLETGRQKIAEVIRRNEDKWSGCFIAGLIVVLIILLVLVLVI